MKKDGKYRFTLQFGSDTEEQIQAGELLETLGNRKSTVIVDALNEYLITHPHLKNVHGKLEVKVASNYNYSKIEQLIRSIVDEKLAAYRPSDNTAPVEQEENTEALETDVLKMLQNVTLFE